jgi:hypothetical protein
LGAIAGRRLLDTRFRGYDGCAWGIPRGKISWPGRTYLSLALSRC